MAPSNRLPSRAATSPLRRFVRVLIALVGLAVLPAPSRAQGSYDRAIELVGLGRIAAAVAEARTIDDPLLAAQALVYANFSGRDYAEALRAAEAGLAASADVPGDGARLWLADRAIAAALYFEATERAAPWVDTLESEVGELPEGEGRDAWMGAVDAHRSALAERVQAEEDRHEAVARARWTALGVAAFALGLGLFLCLGGSRTADV